MSTGTLILRDINPEYPNLRFRVVWTSDMKLTKISALQNQYSVSYTITARLYYEGPSTLVGGQVSLYIGDTTYSSQFTSFSGKVLTYTKVIQAGYVTSGQKKNLNLSMTISADIGDKNSSISKTYLLTTYTSYSPCSWGSGANIHAAATHCIPGNKILVDWTPAANGGAAEVGGYTVYYRFYPGLDSGTNEEWIGYAGNLKATNITIPVPSEAADPNIRSKYLQVRVKANSTVMGYDSVSELTSTNVCKVNHIPPTPTITSPDIISYTKESAEFKVQQGADEDGHQLYLYYKDQGSADWLEATLSQGNFIYSLKEGQSTTLKFRNFDGYEFSESTKDIDIARNSYPGVFVDLIEDDETDGALPRIQITPCGGQESTNKYTCEIVNDNGVILETLLGQQNSLESIILKTSDIRELISRASGPLKEKTYYNYTIKVKRNDGIDDSRIEKRISGFKTPAILLTNGLTDEFNACFCDKLIVNLNNWEYGSINRKEYGIYKKVKYMGAEGKFSDNGGYANINTEALEYGARTFILSFNDDSFNLELEETLSKVKKIEFTPSEGNSTVFVNPILKPYTQDLFIQLRGFSNLGDYGLIQIPKLNLTKLGSKTSFTLAAREESNNDFYSYQVSKEDFWAWCVDEQQSNFTGTIEITLGMKNIFGKEFTQNFLLKLDFKEKPIFESGFLYAKYDSLSEENALSASLDKWQYLIEKMPIWANLTFKSYNLNPTIEIQCLQGNVDVIKPTIESADINESQSSSTPGNPNIYEIDKSIFELPSFVTKTSLDFIVTIKNEATEIDKNLYIERKIYENLPAEGFVPALIKLNRAEYKNDNLEVDWQITNFGYTQTEKEDNGSKIIEGTGKAVSVEIYPTTYESQESLATFNIAKDQSQSPTGSGVKENFEGFSRGELLYDYIYITPKLITSLATYLIADAEKQPYFEITKETTSINPIIVYNLMPTVAYRQNHLGINTNNLDNMMDAALVIGSHSTRNKIYLKTLKGDMVINLSDGTITGSDMTIDLIKRTITGTTIEGGSW